MIDAGVSITRVAKKLSVGKDTVKAAAAAAKSEAAMQGLAEGQPSLSEAAALTEFEDLPGAINRLMQVAGTRSFEHVVAQLRQERAAAEAEAAAAQPYVERGSPGYSSARTPQILAASPCATCSPQTVPRPMSRR